MLVNPGLVILTDIVNKSNQEQRGCSGPQCPSIVYSSICNRTGGRGYKALPLGSWRRRHSPVGFPQTAAGL